MADTATASVRLPARQRRQQLLDVALGVFSRLGYHETSMNALYQHFAPKHDLFRELLAQTGDRLLTAISEQAHSLDTPRQRVEAGFRAFFDFFDEHPDAFGVLYGSSLGSDPSFREEARRVQDNFAEYVSRLIKVTDHDDAVAMASGINGLSEGMIRHWMHHGRSRPAAEMAALTARLAWGGLERLA